MSVKGRENTKNIEKNNNFALENLEGTHFASVALSDSYNNMICISE